MTYNAKNIAPPGYFEHAEKEREKYQAKQAEMTNEALLKRIEAIEVVLRNNATPITYPGENFPQIK